MGSPWIEADCVAIDALPEWARAVLPESGVALAREGVVAREPRAKASCATWGHVFGVALHADDPRLLVLVPRMPPAPPWFEVHCADAVEQAALARSIRERVVHGGPYRGREPGAPRLAAGELLQRALEHCAIPGAVEIPVALPDLTQRLTAWLLVRLRVRAERRVLLLAPDGCICGFEERIAAFAWSDISEFHVEGAASGRVRRVLAVHGHDGRVHGRIDSRWFSEPLQLILQVAEAYRKRAAC